MKKQKVVILGAGITGLVAAYYFSKDYRVTLIEKESFLGGSAFGFNYKNFTLDFGPHKIYTEIPGILEEINKIVELNRIKKKNSIYLNSTYFDFPLRLSQVLLKMPSKAFKAGLDIILKNFKKFPDDSYENFLINRFGKTLYNLSFKDYAEKVWSTNPLNLDAELAKRRVAVSGIGELIKSILLNKNKNISAEYFYYPPKGIKQLIDSLINKIKENRGEILLSSKVSKIAIKDNKINFIKLNKRKIKADYLISTIPLDELIRFINAKKPLSSLVSRLRYQKLNIIYFILNKNKSLNDCWIFFPEKKFLFHRVSEQKAFSSHMGPNNKTVLMVETTKEVNQDLIDKIILQLESIKILKNSEIDEYFVKSYDKAYPIYEKGFKNYLDDILDKIEFFENFYSLGRPGLFNYNNMDQCWDMAKKTFDHIKNKGSKEDWQKIKKYFNNYRIVD
jgi:protoporphyrinogen oxidase